MQIILVAATDIIGTELRHVFHRENLIVKVLGQTKPELYSTECYEYFSIGDSLLRHIKSQDLCVIFFFAYDFSDTKDDLTSTNVAGFQQIIEDTKHLSNCKIVYPSTLLHNRSDNDSAYQAQKRFVESIFPFESGLLVKPSLVIGHAGGVSRLLKSIAAVGLPIPLPKIDNNIAPIKADKLAFKIYEMAVVNRLSGSYILRGKNSKTFKKIIREEFNLKSFYISPSLLELIIFILTFLKPPKWYYLSQRILGLVNVPDIDQACKVSEFKIIDS